MESVFLAALEEIKEFSRLGTSSDAEKKAKGIQQELTSKFSSKISEIKGFIARVK